MIQYENATINFDNNWKFHLGTPSSGEPRRGFRKACYATAAAGRKYNDSDWRSVNLPHDWGMELDYDFTSAVHNGALPIQTGKKTYPIGFYRKTFDIPKDWEDKQIYIDFEGIFRNCDLHINGQYITHNVSGYVGFQLDITEFLYYGEENSMAVRIDASTDEGWFYEGAGIYRHVWLHVLPKLHVDPKTVFVHSDINGDEADVTAEFTVINASDRELGATFGFEIAEEKAAEYVTVPAFSEKRISCKVHLESFHAWDLEDPYLYKVRVGNFDAMESIYTIKFGIRSIRFDADKGFFLNGKPVKILGSSTHQDFTGIGSALNDDMQRYKVKVLKKYGFNGLRTAHNQPSPALLDACDELGMLVMNEARLFGSSPEAMSQYERTVLRDRNHPSVFIWVLGNEEIVENIDYGKRQALTAMRLIKSLDPTRPISCACNNGGETNGINEVVDVRGVNYMAMWKDVTDIDAYHSHYPNQPVIGTEENSIVATRGCYRADPYNNYKEDFDNMAARVSRGAEAMWNALMARDYYSGAFVWTGMDYRGEASKRSYITNFGVIDLCGYPKSAAYYYQSATAKEPVLYVHPNLNFVPDPGEKTLLRCYSNLEEVEFIADGKCIGRYKRDPYRSIDVYLEEHPEEVVAIGYQDGKEAARYVMRKAEEPVELVVTPEIIGNTAFVHVEAADAKGVLHPETSNRIHFDAAGCNILGVGNGNPSDEDKELLLPVEVKRELKGFRVHEIHENRYYSDQNLEDVIGDIEFEHEYTYYIEYAEEPVENSLLYVGPRRHLPMPMEKKSPEERLEVLCNFWADKEDLEYTHLRVGYIAGVAKITLNGKEIFGGDAYSDAVRVSLDGSLIQGENLLKVEIKPNSDKNYGIGKGIALLKVEKPKYSRRLFKGKALCMVDISNGGKLTVSSDNMKSVNLIF